MILTKLGKVFLLLTIAMVESKSPPIRQGYPWDIHEECCAQKVVGNVFYTLFHDVFHGSIPHQCLNNCIYTKTFDPTSPKYCFERGDFQTECLSGNHGSGSGDHGSGSGSGDHGSGDHGSGSGDHGSGSVDHSSGSGDHGSGSGDHGSGSGDHGSGSGDHGSGSGDFGSGSGDHGSGSGDHGSGSGDHGSGSTIELVGGAGPHEGNIMISGRPVCDHGRNPENAKVVCRQLGYLGGDLTTGSHFGTVPEDDFAMNDVHCNGTEGYIWRCLHENSINQPINCTREEGMGVICSGVKVTVKVLDTNPGIDTVEDAKVQLTLGDETMTATTDIDGQARFTLSSDMMLLVNGGAPDGAEADVQVTASSYATKYDKIMIRPDVEFQTFEISSDYIP